MSTARTLEYTVTLYFRFATVYRTERARCVAEAIQKAREQLPWATAALAIIAVPKE